MDSGRDSHEVGEHTRPPLSLGPHVVGRRVVVRRLVRGEVGPSGGPALTDLLGVCTAWGDGMCVVQPESGAPVAIPIRDIVSGKPVPPRPSVRHRVSVREAESHAAPLWPGVVREPLGDWELRTDPARLLKRTNSCLAVGDPGLSPADASAAVLAFYSERGRDPLIQVVVDSEEERLLLDQGWAPLSHGSSHFLLASLARVRRSLRRRLADVSVGAIASLEADGPRASVALRVGPLEVARAEAGIDRDWLGLHGLEVAEPHRRQGLALQAVDALLEWGAEQGATTAWLHVETDNAPALALHESLGFAVHHTMRYLAAT